MKIHHVGYLTNKIQSSIEYFQDLGYKADEVYEDNIQLCNICLLYHKESGDCIELVEPYEANAQMQRLLKKRGCGIYHICYEVDDVNAVCDEFCSKEGWMNIFKPVKAIALDNRLITYFYNPNIGFIEFVNSK